MNVLNNNVEFKKFSSSITKSNNMVLNQLIDAGTLSDSKSKSDLVRKL